MDIVERLRNGCTCNFESTPCGAEEECRNAFDGADEIKRLREALRQITELSPFKSNTGNASTQYITQMLVKMTALAHEALKEKE